MKKRLVISIFLLSFAFVFAGAVSAAAVKSNQLTTETSDGGIISHQHQLKIENTGLVSKQKNLNVSSVTNTKVTSVTPLKVTSTNPANHSVNIPTTKLIRIKFNGIIKDSNRQLIQLRKGDGTVIPVTYTIRNNEIFIDHTPFNKYTSYTLSLKRYSLKDSSGNVLTSTYQTKFKTGYTNLSIFKAKLIIQKLGVRPNIYEDSPNHYNAVYHYSNSAYFGTPGDCAFLGHRTTYSAILRYINLLNYGDQIIIKDYTSNKISTYKVVSHEIRYNYQLTHNFKKYGTSNLILKSCYPVGYSYMKWIVHAVLVSTVPI
ncbi:MAG: Ig-like domain-containing protein [Methanobacterium sp. ERen5]|nr:MAG: Ig-like domain-containing protein [Methanobacterium sp. ERen5]